MQYTAVERLFYLHHNTSGSTSAKSLFLPPKDGWKIVRLHVPGPSSGEDTVSNIL